jgi:hypothetical protein
LAQHSVHDDMVRFNNRVAIHADPCAGATGERTVGSVIALARLVWKGDSSFLCDVIVAVAAGDCERFASGGRTWSMQRDFNVEDVVLDGGFHGC